MSALGKLTTGPWWATLFRGLVFLAVGIVFISSPRISTNVSIRLMGATLLFFGALTIVELLMGEYKESRVLHLLLATVAIISGLFMLTHTIIGGALTLTTISILLASALLIVGIMNLAFGLRGDGWAVALLGVTSLILGIILLLNPLKAGVVLPLAFGIISTAGGVILVLISLLELVKEKQA